MAAAAGDVVKLVVAQLARLRVEQVEIRLRAFLRQLHAVFLGECDQLLGSFCFLCLRKQFFVKLHRVFPLDKWLIGFFPYVYFLHAG